MSQCCFVDVVALELVSEDKATIFIILYYTGDGMYDIDEYLFLMYLKWNDQESVDDIKEAFRVFDQVCTGKGG